MTKGYSGASFSTKGNWLIPMVLGWSKSVVSMNRPIGIMFTLHITPYLNIGFNNPHPKYKPQLVEKQSDCGCMGPCECDCIACENEEHLYHAHCLASEFVMNSDPEQVFGVFPRLDEHGNPLLLFFVASEDVNIPEHFNNVPTRKDVKSLPTTFTENEFE